ncbi:MAG TPA: CHAP domain-containing protein [Acidimicrobiales bacterium]|nr:CHAP domain-containing protein [Acidimicrobiales bacterium]
MKGLVGRVCRRAAGLAAAAGFAAWGLSPSQPAAHLGGVERAAYADAGVLNYGDAVFAGSPTNTHLSAPVVGMAANRGGSGYWLVAADGGVFNYGGAGFYGSAGSVDLYAPMIGMVGTPDGGGYWLVATDGGVFNYGDAKYFGSMGGQHLNSPIVGIASTPTGNGYWLVAADGGIFNFGDARFFGSEGAVKLNSPIVGMAATADGDGYWMVGGDGGIFNFGDAPFEGTPAAKGISGWATGMAATSDGKGYWIANANGAIYTEGDAVFYGNNLGTPRVEPISAIAATPSGKGYWLLEPDAFPTDFAHPGGGGAIVSVATSQIQGDPVSGYFCNPYGPCEAWCALFATWVWQRAGVAVPTYAFVGDIYTWAASHTAVLAPSARPSPGDLVLYGTGPWNVDTAEHVGVVAQVWPDGSIDTIEGDAGPAPTGYFNVIINGPFRPDHSMEYNGMPIFAYAVP